MSVSAKAFGGAVGLALLGSAAWAECTPRAHVVAEGETVFTLSETYYGEIEKWSLIFYSNQQDLANPLEIPAGTELTIPCPLDGSDFALVAEPDPEPAPVEIVQADLMFVTSHGNAPFADKDWPGEGMITELLTASLNLSSNPIEYSITWKPAGAETLVPALDAKEFDMGFPWYRPDCDGNPEDKMCQDFHFSEPVVEVLDLLFVKAGSDVTYNLERDLHGRTLCRPQGLVTHQLDTPERRWLSEGHVTLVQPETLEACFTGLMAGDVDAVAINEFSGWETLGALDLKGEVVPLQRPLGVEGLHVIISKTHWRGTTHLFRVNSGLAALKADPQYEEIVSRHLGVFWDRIN